MTQRLNGRFISNEEAFRLRDERWEELLKSGLDEDEISEFWDECCESNDTSLQQFLGL